MTDQATFLAALRDAAAPVPQGLRAPGDRPAGKRFDVYRNNVVSSLIAALREGFPAVDRLVGAEFFDAMAAVFVRAHPPESPVLQLYGGAFPGWLERFEPARGLPYLADVARLDLALRQAYHAADAAPIDPARLSALPPERLLASRLVFAPAVRLVPSPYPLVAIRRSAMEAGAPKPAAVAETALVTRPGFDPHADALAPGAAACVTACLAGQPLEAALTAAAAAAPEFDLTATLTLLLSREALTDLTEDPAP